MNKKRMSDSEIKKTQLEVLMNIDAFCRKNNIKYFLAYGTLIGAIRHNGYIPWDDDIDIEMLRPDYDRFMQLYNKTDDGFKAICFELDEECPYPYGKAYKTNTYIVENASIKNTIGVNVDIFPIDAIASEKEIKKQNMLRKCLDAKIVKISKDRAFTKNLLLSILKIPLLLFNVKSLVRKMTSKGNAENFKNAKYVGAFTDGSVGLSLAPILWYEEVIEHTFEDNKVYIPKMYHEILNDYYGDYMKLPPLEQQETHHDCEAYYVN